MSAEYVVEGWLTEAYDYEPPRRGQTRQGVILKIEESGATIDIGLKRDGFVPYRDVERLEKETSARLRPGQEVMACVVRPRDRNGNPILSLYQAWLEKDWVKAQELFERGDVWHGKAVGYNRGGLIVKFGLLNAFVPASHLTKVRHYTSRAQREMDLKAYVGQSLPLKVIEVNKYRRRLIMSEQLAVQQIRERNMERLLEELVEGEVCQGTVRRLCNFGAFVDLGGADGLIHISEVTWRQIQHPREVLKVDDEVDVYVLRLDRRRKRISLSLKRLQPSPWETVDETYTADQLVSGTVTNVVDFGAFVALDAGVEGLVHVSELADPPPVPREFVKRGDELVLRILRVDSLNRRIALSLKQVDEDESAEWLAQQESAQAVEAGEDEECQASQETAEDMPSPLAAETGEAEESVPAASGQAVEETLEDALPSASDKQPEDEGFWLSLVRDEEAVPV